MPQRDGPSCPGCGLPNYDGLCPVCRGDEDGYREELQGAFGPWDREDDESEELPVPDRQTETVTLTLSREDAWRLYDLVTGRAELIAAKEYEAMQSLGGSPWYALARKIGGLLGDPRAASSAGGR